MGISNGRRRIVFALLLGGIHAAVDAGTVSVVMDEVTSGPWQPQSGATAMDGTRSLILLYNFLAFGLQLPFGLAADRWRLYTTFAVVGICGTTAAIFFRAAGPWAAATMAGLGNALFHVGAGAMVLQSAPGRATEPALFIAPGDLGLNLGVRLGAAGSPGQWVLAAVLAVAAAIVAFVGAPAPCLPRVSRRDMRKGWAWGCAVLLLFPVFVRALVGDCIGGAWRSQLEMATALSVCALGGKALGGILADRLGWFRLALEVLVVAAPLAAVSLVSARMAIPCAFLLQMTTGITVAGLFVLAPTRPGTVFGAASLTLLLGLVPGYLAIIPTASRGLFLAALILLSAVALGVGLSRTVLGSRDAP